MKFSIRNVIPERVKTGCLVLGVFFGSAKSGLPDFPEATRRVDQAAAGRLRKLAAAGDLSGRKSSSLVLHGLTGVSATRVLLVGLGARAEFTENAYRESLRAAAAATKDLGATDAVVCIPDGELAESASRKLAWRVRHAVFMLGDAFYRFEGLKSRNAAHPWKLQELTIGLSSRPDTATQKAFDAAVATLGGVSLARTLGNLPANVCTPTYLADEARKLARQFKIGIEVLERRDMEKLGMGALLAVTRGTAEPPKLIVLKYQGGSKDARPVVLVGKGITFDTGGISLKPSAEMDEMKFDMSGAASVLGAVRALAAMKATVNVIGLIPACENMPSGTAIKPGDIVKSMSGQTVEILNTDAEGRLILCDALTYSERFNPDIVVDVATLTGACVIALGHVASGLFSNHQPLANEIMGAADEAWDRVWQLPLWEDYQDGLRSNFADMANVGGRPAGSITAACYLARFTRKLRWAHLDIAGTAWKSGREKGSTGRPVPLLVQLALGRADRR